MDYYFYLHVGNFVDLLRGKHKAFRTISFVALRIWIGLFTERLADDPFQNSAHAFIIKLNHLITSGETAPDNFANIYSYREAAMSTSRFDNIQNSHRIRTKGTKTTCHISSKKFYRNFNAVVNQFSCVEMVYFGPYFSDSCMIPSDSDEKQK